MPQNLELKDSDGFTALHKAISQLSVTESSTLFIKTLRLRGASNKTKTDAGESCLDLIPDEVSRETMTKATELLRKHKCSCQCTYTFRFLPIKSARSISTMLVYFAILAFVIIVHITMILPSKCATPTSKIIPSLTVID